MRKNIFAAAGGWLLVIACGTGSAQTGADYGADLGALYGERYWIQAYKDVCVSVLPKSRRDLQGAYDEWRARHEEVVEDLELRFAAMVKGMSRDEAEYQQNYNKYYDVVMRQRDEDKGNLRKLPREDLVKQCKELPGYLRGPGSDMYNTHPKAFGAIYGKKRP